MYNSIAISLLTSKLMLPGGNKPVYLLYTEMIQRMFFETKS